MTSHAATAPETGSRRRADPPATRRYRPDIQGLRAVAVLLVVLYHAGVPLLHGGYVGVDVFFVISGYLITTQLAREVERTGRVSLWQFYARRFRRLLPPAALVVVTTLVVARFVLPYQQLSSLTKDAFYTAIYGINYHLAVEGIQYQAATLPPSPLQHYWSLAVEEQFYAFWPLLMLGCALLGRRRWRRPLLVAAIVVICAVSLYLSITQTGTDGSLAYFGIQTRAWELGAGALLSLGSPLVVRLGDRTCRVVGWAGLAAVLVSAFWYDDRTAFPGTAALLPVLGAVAILAAGTRAVDHSLETGVLSHGVMQYVGRTSYAWYLWHWPMLILLPAWYGQPLNLAERIEVVFIAFWFAVLTYFLENASARSLWRAGRWLAAGLALSLTIVAATSAVVILMPSLQGKGQAVVSMKLTQADPSAVRKAVAAGFLVKAVPTNLTPSLTDAADDYPWEIKQDCHANLLRSTSLQCVTGDLHGQHVAVLLGDSHAEQWLNALEATADHTGWRIVNLTKAACPVADVSVYNQDLNREYSECDTFHKDVAAAIGKLKPDLIIASEADAVGGGEYTPDQWADATVSTLTKEAGSTSSVVYLGDSPYMTTEANDCLESHLDDARKCVYLRNENPTWSAMYDVMQHRVAAAGMAYVNTRDFFCNQDACPPIVNGMLTHRDQGHVTNTYAKWLAPMFAPIFEGNKS